MPDSLTHTLAYRGGFTDPKTDPMRGFYGIVSAILILEAIATLLAITVVIKNTSHQTLAALCLLGVSCVEISLCAMVKKRWFWYALTGVQMCILAMGVFHIGISIMGGCFIASWIYTIIVGKKIQDRIAHGLLPGQHPLNS